MKVDGRHITPGIRRDGGAKPFRAENIVSALHYSAGVFTVRVDDKDNPEFWLEIVIPESEMEAIRADSRSNRSGGESEARDPIGSP